MVISDKRKWIYYISPLHDGSKVDMNLLTQEFTLDKDWCRKQKIIVDLGFTGIDKLYEIKELMIGKKRPRRTKKILHQN